MGHGGESLHDIADIQMLIDLLLLLRAVRRTPASLDRKERPIALDILELLFCILVDSPEHTRTFERLGGLEATTRVLKGSGVDKEVKMRCLEFLYFYLLPEQTTAGDDTALRSASGSSATTTSTEPYPPSPVSSTTRIEDSRVSVAGLDDPSSAFLAASRMSQQSAFVPQTPKKKSQPALGFMTPSNHLRKASGSMANRSITPTLETVPPSPEVFVQARQADGGKSRELGTPVKRGSSGMQRSSTMLDLVGSEDRRVTAVHQRVSDSSKPLTPARRSMPPPASPARFLQATDAPPLPTPRKVSGENFSTARRSSTMLSLDRASQEPPRPPSSAFKVPTTPKSTPSALQSKPITPKSSQAPRTRHSLAPSHTYASLPNADAPPLPNRTPMSSRTGPGEVRRESEASRGERTPSKTRRSETGLPAVPRVPPSPSMGVLGLGRGMPLSSSRRAVSKGNSRDDGKEKEKGVKSVLEKKELVSVLEFWLPINDPS